MAFYQFDAHIHSHPKHIARFVKSYARYSMLIIILLQRPGKITFSHSERTNRWGQKSKLIFSVLSLLGQQQQFHFAFGQRPFHFPADPLSGFRMPPIGNCQSEYFVWQIWFSYSFFMVDLICVSFLSFYSQFLHYQRRTFVRNGLLWPTKSNPTLKLGNMVSFCCLKKSKCEIWVKIPCLHTIFFHHHSFNPQIYIENMHSIPCYR